MALYPPVVASSMPAFNIDTGVKIYFSLSSYNTIRKDDIKAVHVSVRRQTSNVNVLRSASQIIQRSLQQDQIDKKLNRYYVELTKDDIIDCAPDVLYKVQLRFSSIIFNSDDSIVEYSYNNIDQFSEWSTVCIIKPIIKPLFYIDQFYIGKDPQETDENNYYSVLPDFNLVYKPGEYKTQDGITKYGTQILRYWRLKLLSQGYTSDSLLDIEDYILADSGKMLNSAENYNINDGSVVASCSLPYELENDVSYKLLLEIETKNGYQGSWLYPFTCKAQSVNPLNGTLTASINEENGYIKLDFISTDAGMTNLLLRRTDSKSGFSAWQDLKYFEVYDSYNFTYYDFTAQSGLLYRYLIQKIDSRGRRGTPVYDQSYEDNTGIMVEWQHPFLLESTGNGNLEGTKQLRLQYDFQISSYKTNISESKTDTIGSKYPFIRRNGQMYYRSFPITGTITEYMDEADLFTNKNQLFDNIYNKYAEYRGQIDSFVNTYNYTYERKFREKVEEFLYNSKPKLYKSMQQGNIFIKLMQISLTPKNELGRLVYSFSATAYQIDQATINSYNNYNLITVGHFNPFLSQTGTVLGQITSYDFSDNIEGNLFKAGKDIVGADQSTAAATSIASFIKYNESFNGAIVTDFTINWLRLTFESDPYLIIQDTDGSFRPFDDVIPEYTTNISSYTDKNIIRNNNIQSIRNNEYQDEISNPINYPLYQMQSVYDKTNVYLGWLFYINDKPIIVSPPNNIYQLKEEAISLPRTTKIVLAKDTAMLVDFNLIDVKQEDLSLIPKTIRVNRVNGQLIGTYSEENNLISAIKMKYKYEYTKGTQKLKYYVSNVNSILVDTQPRTVIELKTSVMDSASRFIVNETGQLAFDPQDFNVGITSLKIIGRNIILDQEAEYPQDYQNPINGDIREIDGEYQYYYSNQWRRADLMDNGTTLDVHLPVDALLFYFISVQEEVY